MIILKIKIAKLAPQVLEVQIWKETKMKNNKKKPKNNSKLDLHKNSIILPLLKSSRTRNKNKSSTTIPPKKKKNKIVQK